MPRKLLMPSKGELPSGPLRKFVKELHVHFRNAGRPSPAQIAKGCPAKILAPSAEQPEEPARCSTGGS